MTSNFMRRVRRAIMGLVAIVLAAVTMVGSAAAGNAENSVDATQQHRNAEVVRNAFARGVGDEASFYSILAEDVQWTVARAVGPTTYTSRTEFLQEGAGPILTRLTGPIHANVRELITENDVVVAIWEGTATARDGLPYVNNYAWVMTMRDERVVRMTAYLDFMALNELLDRVTPS